MHQMCCGTGTFESDDHREEVIVDSDLGGGVLGGVAVTRHDEDDRFADMIDLILRQGIARARRRQRRMRDEQGQVLPHRSGEVLVGPDPDQTGSLQRLRDVDVDDPRVRVRAAHEGGFICRVPQVVEIVPAAGDQARVLAALDRRPEHLGRHRSWPPCSAMISAARRTDFTMF